jgi:transposase, IS30 family
MRTYRRVTHSERCQISAYLQAGFSVPSIAKRLKFHKTTIYRELKRNGAIQLYCPYKADQKTSSRYKRSRNPYKLKGDLKSLVSKKLRQGWSPEQISGRLKSEVLINISHESIYRLIRRNFDLKCYLRRRRLKGAGRYRQRRALKQWGDPIYKRSVLANERKRRGDWERDLMHAGHKNHLLVCTDRKTRYTKIAKVDELTALGVGDQTKTLIESTKTRVFSVTNDNGSEFRCNLPLKAKHYYCTPFKPQQRGTVENTIGLLRQYVDRRMNLKLFSKVNCNYLENKINLRPRKCLDFRSPFEVFYKQKVALVT